MVSFILLQNFFIFDIVRTKAVRINNFIDEYIAIASNVNFYKSLDFNAGDFIGGSYSVLLTSGPVSSVGGVLGWNLSNSFIISRISNFYWIFILQIFFCLLINKYYGKDNKFFFLFFPLAILLIPWWQGSLYSIGEIASSLIFINSIFLFNKNRKLALILFGISIFFGKILTSLLFIGFYIPILLFEKNIKNILNDFLYFMFSGFIWGLLVIAFYESGNLIDYILDQKNLILGHQSSGAASSQIVNLNSFIEQINSSEVQNWNLYEKIRVAFIPCLFAFLVFTSRKEINKIFGNISYSIIFSLLLEFFWFWFLSPTKWIRYSQHFTVLVIIGLFYLVNFEIFSSKIKIFLTTFSILIFIDNEKNLIFIGLAVLFMMAIFFNKKNQILYSKIALILILTIDVGLPYFEKDSLSKINEVIIECQADLYSDVCRETYLRNQ